MVVPIPKPFLMRVKAILVPAAAGRVASLRDLHWRNLSRSCFPSSTTGLTLRNLPTDGYHPDVTIMAVGACCRSWMRESLKASCRNMSPAGIPSSSRSSICRPTGLATSSSAGPSYRLTGGARHPRYYDVIIPDGYRGLCGWRTRVPVTGEESLIISRRNRTPGLGSNRAAHPLCALFGGIALVTLSATGLALLMVRHIVVMLSGSAINWPTLRSDRPIARIGADFPVNCVHLPKPSIRACITRMWLSSASAASPAMWPTSCGMPLAEIRISESALIDADPPESSAPGMQRSRPSSRMQRSVDTCCCWRGLEWPTHTCA